MKKMLIMLAAVLLLGSGCGNESNKEAKAENIINYVPAEANGVFKIDAERLLKLPLIEDLRKENKDFKDNWTKFESELKKYGLKTSDLPSKLIMFFNVGPGTQDAGVLALSEKINEAKLVKLLKANKTTVSYTEKTIAGRKAYIVSQKDEKNKDKVAITYIKENLVLLCDEKKAEQFFKAVGKTKNNKLIASDKKADKKALASVLYVKTAKAAPAPAPGMTAPQNPADTINSATIALNLVGNNQKDISLKADVECIDKTNAAQLAGQMKMMTMMMTMQFAQNQELSQALTEAIKVEQKEKNVNINISVPETLMKKIQAAMEEKKKQAQARRMAPAPVRTAPKAVRRSAAPVKAAPVKAAK